MRKLIQKTKYLLLYPKKYRDFIKHLKVFRVTKLDFEDNLLKNEIFNTYRDIFGHGAGEWGEYVKCVSCGKIYDIETIHDLKSYVHISDLPKSMPSSNCCYATLDYFHTDSLLQDKFNLLFQKKDTVMYILKDQSINRVVGLVLGCIDNFDIVWNEYIKDKLVIADENFRGDSLLKESVIYIDELGIIKSHRWGKFPLFKQFGVFLHDIKGLGGAQKIVFWTSKDSKLYKLIQQLSYTTLVEDSQTPPRVVISLPFKETYRKIRLLHIVYT